jgi:hypothetical protein
MNRHPLLRAQPIRSADARCDEAQALALEHAFLCHVDGEPCADGCDVRADPERLAILDKADRA